MLLFPTEAPRALGLRLASAVICALLTPLVAPALSRAATPVASSISLETSARVCTGPGSCGTLVDQETGIGNDAQGPTLNSLAAVADASADSGSGPNANATISMTAQFVSASAGSTSFVGDTGIFDPDSDFTHACEALNNGSQGFSYAFVSSADGFIDLDYSLACSPVDGTTCSGRLEIFWDGSLIAAANAFSSSTTAMGTVSRPVVLGATHTLEIRPEVSGVGGTGCGTPPGVSWTANGSVDWSFDADTNDVVSHTFSGRAVADPTLVSGTVPPDVQAFLDGQGLDGGWFAASFSFDTSTPDSDSAPESAEFRDALIDSTLRFGSLQHELADYCNPVLLDCSIFVDNDLPFFGTLRDEYTLRARNLRLLGLPQISLPGSGTTVDAFIINASFILQATELDLSPPPMLLDSTGIDPDIEALFGPGTHDIILTYFGIGPTGSSYSLGYRVEAPFFLPEPNGVLGLTIGFLGLVLVRRTSRIAHPR